MKNLILSGLAFLSLTAFCFHTPAAAQGVLVFDIYDNTGEAFYVDSSANYFSNIDHNTAQNFGLDFNDVANAPFTSNGYSGVGYADQTVAFTPSNPGISGNFGVHNVMASASATVSASGGFDAEYAYGLPFGYIIFSVAQNTQWSITGSAWGNTLAVGSGISQADYLFRFQKYLNNNIFLVNQSNQSLNGNGNYNDTLNFGGVLPPATYIWEYRTFSQHGGSIFSPPVFGTASSGYNLTLTLTAVPEPATLTLFLLAASAISPRLRRG